MRTTCVPQLDYYFSHPATMAVAESSTITVAWLRSTNTQKCFATARIRTEVDPCGTHGALPLCYSDTEMTSVGVEPTLPVHGLHVVITVSPWACITAHLDAIGRPLSGPVRLVWATGFEPATSCAQGTRPTTELRPSITCRRRPSPTRMRQAASRARRHNR